MSKKTKAHEEPTPIVAAPVVENLVPPTAPAVTDAPIISVSNTEAFSEPVIEPARTKGGSILTHSTALVDLRNAAVPTKPAEPVKTMGTMGGSVRKDY